MGARFGAALSSLGARLLVPLLLTVAGVLSLHAVTSLRSIQEGYLTFMSEEAHRSSGLIRRATHDGMLLNRLDEVQATIERLAEGTEVAAIRVYDRKGTIVLSSDPAEIGTGVPPGSDSCASCHGEGQRIATPARRDASDLISTGDKRVLRELSVIDNEPSCSATGCHVDVAEETVLGVLDVTMSMVPMESAMNSARSQLLGTTFVLMLTLGLVAVVVVRRFIQRPIRSLQEGTRRIAGGDLATRIDVRGEHELARLARDFNRMAEDLSRAQGELTEWSHTLEEKVTEKTAELRNAQRQVMHMEKMASLGKLSATVAHELNNPISGMLTYARLIERELTGQPTTPESRAEVKRYLHLVQQECTRCGEIVNNMLVFARRTGGEMASVDLNEVVDRSLMLVRHRLDIAGTELRTTFLEGNSRVVADPGQVQQALVALLVNAVEAMKEDGVLTVRIEEEAGGVRVHIADTGPGIPADVLPLIFEPFFSTKDKESGVGLGLAVVYGIVHRHGGRIEVESQPGAGTTFHLWFPRIPPAAHTDPTGSESPALPESHAPAHVP